MGAPRAVVILTLVTFLAGCGRTSERDQVRDKVNQFAKATASKDYKTLCDQVLAPALVAHLTAYGIQCERAMALALSGVRNPVLSIGKISVRGQKASVITLTTAQGQTATVEALELVKTSKGWRIESLNASLTSALSGGSG